MPDEPGPDLRRLVHLAMGDEDAATWLNAWVTASPVARISMRTEVRIRAVDAARQALRTEAEHPFRNDPNAH